MKRIIIILFAISVVICNAQVRLGLQKWGNEIWDENVVPDITQYYFQKQIIEMLGEDGYRTEVLDRLHNDSIHRCQTPKGLIIIVPDGTLSYVKNTPDRLESWVDTIGSRLCDYMTDNHAVIPLYSIGNISADEINQLDCSDLRSTVERRKATLLVEFFVKSQGRRLLQRNYRYSLQRDLREIIESGLFRPLKIEIDLTLKPRMALNDAQMAGTHDQKNESTTRWLQVYKKESANVKAIIPDCEEYRITDLTSFPSAEAVKEVFKTRYPEMYLEYQNSGELDRLISIINRINSGLNEGWFRPEIVAGQENDENLQELKSTLVKIFSDDKTSCNNHPRVKFVSGTPLSYFELPPWENAYAKLLPHYYLIKYKGKEWYKKNIYYTWLNTKDDKEARRSFRCQMKLKADGTFDILGPNARANEICRELADSLCSNKAPMWVLYSSCRNRDVFPTDDCRTMKERIIQIKANHIVLALYSDLMENRLEDFYNKFSSESSQSKIGFTPMGLWFNLYLEPYIWFSVGFIPETKADGDRLIETIITRTENLLDKYKSQISITADCSDITNETYTDLPSVIELKDAIRYIMPEIADEFIDSDNFKRLVKCLYSD